MYATLLTALAVLVQPPVGQPNAPGQPRRERDARAGQAAGHSMDGKWTVVAFEKNGQPVANGTSMTATIQNNVLTFAGGADTNRPHVMRLEHSPLGGLIVSSSATGTGAGTPGTPNAPPRPGTPPAAPPGAGASAAALPQMGTVIHTRDFLVIAMRESLGAPGRGAPVAGAPGARAPLPGTRPASPPPGTPGPGTTGTPRQAAGNTANTDIGASNDARFATVLILKRTGSGNGASGISPGTPERK
jgi:hypothetical protein